MKKTLLATSIASIALSSALSVQAQSFDEFVKGGSVDLNFRYRVESADVKGGADAALANTLKSRATIKTGNMYGFSALVEGDNVFQLTDDFYDKENGNTKADYDLILDQETTQLNQAYLQFDAADTSIKAGNQRIVLDNQRHVGGVAFRQDEATFDAISVSTKALANTTVFAAVANNRNTITNDNTEEDIRLLNVKYAIDKDLSASVFYYGISDSPTTNGLVDYDTFGIRSTGAIEGISFEAELVTQNKTTAAGGDFDSLYYHVNAGTKLGAVKATIGYEAFGSDGGDAAFATPLGTNHKFFGWSDVFLGGAGNDGIQDFYASGVSMISGIKVVGQFHNFSTAEGGDPLGNEIGLMVDKSFGTYGANFKVAQYFASDYAENNVSKADTTKIWLTASAKF
ncbi:hypothetical protein QNI23_003610 [Bermanella sp. WJH001]|uniref:hypothetical protein n=1 Tax=Bermanella sp. WJH001 TaxID=3048005 RepID=UPI0024BD748D|nr:hypothetical protein [Bermanella sp. WJH001]MDJ1539567.1 hypothetical protein [Bermanella sp. WJH001]